MNDLATLEDCRTLVDLFYEEVRRDPILGPIFSSKVASWPQHLDTMARFWFTVLFGRENYHGNPIAKHLPLPVDRGHFDRWLALWQSTIDGRFAGPIASDAKARADRMADVMDGRIRAAAGRGLA
jgi:hemoglobin